MLCYEDTDNEQRQFYKQFYSVEWRMVVPFSRQSKFTYMDTAKTHPLKYRQLEGCSESQAEELQSHSNWTGLENGYYRYYKYRTL